MAGIEMAMRSNKASDVHMYSTSPIKLFSYCCQTEVAGTARTASAFGIDPIWCLFLLAG